MKIPLSASISKDRPLVLFAFEKASAPCGLPKQAALIALAQQEGFKAKENSIAVLHPKSGSPARVVVLAGLGEREGVSTEKLRRAAAAAARKLQALSQKSGSILLPGALGDVQLEARALAEGALLAAYRFDKYRSPDKDRTLLKELALVAAPTALNDAKKGLRLAQIFCDAAHLARDLVNEPPSRLTPTDMAEHARAVAEAGKSAGISVQIFDKAQIEEMKMGALLGVSRGSAEPPVFIHLHYKPEAKPEEKLKSVALVGKGITFDSGGLSLKPAQSMETMKMDMAGAAAILGVFQALAKLKPRVEVHGILAVTENMPGGRASKPGDVSVAMNGKSIEILNTDAEGRLVLADALSYAVQQKPDAIIDIATLTGACIIALGSLVAGAMGNDDALFEAIRKAGDETGESFWRLPLVDEYRDGLKSPVADLKNISSVRGEAGSIIGGLFLREFVDGKPWIHLDIAGPAWANGDSHYLTQGGTGFPARALLQYLLNLQN